MFGRLTWSAFQHDFLQTSVSITIILSAILIFGLVTYLGRWKYLWKEWLTSLDPKRIGLMYLIVVLLMLFKGVMDAAMMRAQLAISVGDNQGFLNANHFQQVFSAHGTTMIFFVGMGVITALMNLIVPLQIGARDVAFPFLNSISFWLFAASAFLINASMMVGKFSATGWLAYPPLSGIAYSPDEGVDYWIWILQISGAGTLLSGVNFLVTIFKMRCPGMTLMKMPLFVWSVLCSAVLIIFAFPVLTATLAMLSLDRMLGMHFFTPEAGGNPMMYVNLIWAWGHPEVYILMLPGFGVFSEIVATYSQKRLFGYTSMVWALVSITFLSFIVWLHHFFTMGASPFVNAFFGIMTMLIAIPTGVKIFNWLFTMYKGRVHFMTPMLWFFAFVFIFSTGGMTGVLMSIPAADFQVHNSLFLIAHFHSMVIGGVLFSFFAALSYWYPKFTGYVLHERIGVWAFWCWFVGFLFAFMPLYVLGLMGATRRLNHYEAATGWQPLHIVAAVGIVFIISGIILQNVQILYSIYKRKELRDLTGDPWNARTLEWSVPSPPPEYNFALTPKVDERDWFWDQKNHASVESEFHDIHMPKNSPMGFYIGLLAAGLGFGLTWHIWWLAIATFLGILICIIVRTFDRHTEHVITKKEIEHDQDVYVKLTKLGGNERKYFVN